MREELQQKMTHIAGFACFECRSSLSDFQQPQYIISSQTILLIIMYSNKWFATNFQKSR